MSLISHPRAAAFEQIHHVLCEHAGAYLDEREEFIIANAKPFAVDEWRFQGLLGFGGKYHRRLNCVTCYPEHLTPAREEILRVTNAALAELSLKLPKECFGGYPPLR